MTCWDVHNVWDIRETVISLMWNLCLRCSPRKRQTFGDSLMQMYVYDLKWNRYFLLHSSQDFVECIKRVSFIWRNFHLKEWNCVFLHVKDRCFGIRWCRYLSQLYTASKEIGSVASKYARFGGMQRTSSFDLVKLSFETWNLCSLYYSFNKKTRDSLVQIYTMQI